MKWLSLSVLLMLMVQPTIKSSIFIWYQINKSTIIQELCENKDTPMMHCDGKCVLAKKIKAAEGTRDEMPALPASLLQEIDPTTITENEIDLTEQYQIVNLGYGSSASYYQSKVIRDIFHPPIAC